MRFPFFKPRHVGPITLLVVAVALWLFVRQAFWFAKPMLLLGLLAATYWLVRPELRAAFGSSGDRRPWLVRLREHEWRPIPFFGRRRVPRWAAYMAALLAWRLLL